MLVQPSCILNAVRHPEAECQSFSPSLATVVARCASVRASAAAAVAPGPAKGKLRIELGSRRPDEKRR